MKPVLVLAALLAFGCDGTTPPEEGEHVLDTAFANDRAAYDFFVSKGLTNFQAAGIVGNLDQESGVNPTIAQYGGGPGRGIAQWSTGGRWDTSSRDNAVWYAGTRGESVWSLNLQLEFIWYELTTFSGYGLAQLRATTNVTNATIVFMDRFEICGTCASSQRVAYAQSVLNAYGNTPRYDARFIDQSAPMEMTSGDTVVAYLEYDNTGSTTWDTTNTRVGTTMPRDRASAFFDSGNWISANRPTAADHSNYTTGATGRFTFTLKAPEVTTDTMFQEHFGLVQESVTWFGPADGAVVMNILVHPRPGSGGSGGSGGAGGSGGTPGGGSGGSGGSAGTVGNGGSGGGNPSGDQGAMVGGCSALPRAEFSGLAIVNCILLIGVIFRRRLARVVAR